MALPSLKIGLIGAGRIGSMHARHLASHIPASEVVVVADTFEDAARQCAERYAIPSYVQDYHRVLERDDVQAVVICSSTDTHARIIEEAAQPVSTSFARNQLRLISRQLTRH